MDEVCYLLRSTFEKALNFFYVIFEAFLYTFLAADKRQTLKGTTFARFKCICQFVHSDNNNDKIMLRDNNDENEDDINISLKRQANRIFAQEKRR